jgi:hypothetical protein
MAVKCPKHNAELEIEYTSINMLGNKYPVVTGQCPKCKIKYLSREIMSSSGTFKIGGHAYEYLNEMELAYPHPFKPLTQSQKQSASQIQDPVPEPVVSIEPSTNVPKEKQARLTKEERKKKQKEAEIEATRKRLSSGKGKAVHVHKLSYPTFMPKVCTKDGQELFYATNVIIDMASAGIKTTAWYCLKCKTAYIPKEDQEIIREKLRKADMRQNLKGNIVLQKVVSVPAPDPNEPVNLAIPQNTLYVCKGLISCNRKGHNVESATGILLAKNGSVIKINTNYCPQCRKYFISYDEYMRYRKLYGILLGNIKVTNGSFAGSETDLAEESILHMCGYSVNQTDNLSPAVRQGILQYLIDSKVSNKPEIIDYLNFFIRRNGKKQNMGEAVRRWNEDLKWVREYQINRQRHFEISNIQKNK